MRALRFPTTSNFNVVAVGISRVMQANNAMNEKEAAAPTLPPEPSAKEKLLTEIRDLLKKN